MAEDVKKKEEAAAMLWKKDKRFWKWVWRQLVCSAGGDFCGRQAAGNEDEKGRGRSGRGGKGLRWKKFAWTRTKKRKKRGAQTNWKPLGAIVRSFGAYGYPAVDSKNQVDMEKAEQLLQFCRAVDRKQEAEITVFEVDYREGFVKYDLQAKRGKRTGAKKLLQIRKRRNAEKNPWNVIRQRTGNIPRRVSDVLGRSFFRGKVCTDAEYGREAYGAADCALDETCREWNRTCILPIGYAYNNMFLTEWKETDFGELNFYDMYDIFYEKLYGKEVPYAADKNVGVRAVYQIPEGEFETVLMKYFRIAPETLRSKTVYCPETGSYAYSPRGLEETSIRNTLYPEVFDFTENSDGTITVWWCGVSLCRETPTCMSMRWW